MSRDANIKFFLFTFFLRANVLTIVVEEFFFLIYTTIILLSYSAIIQCYHTVLVDS